MNRIRELIVLFLARLSKSLKISFMYVAFRSWSIVEPIVVMSLPRA